VGKHVKRWAAHAVAAKSSGMVGTVGGGGQRYSASSEAGVGRPL
jgi:hypothetical protein